MIPFHDLTDDQLFHLCRRYGHQAQLWKRKFSGLLPEVYERKLYEKKGFSSIFEFAAKLAGMNKEQVERILSIDRSFQDKPVLRKLLQDGEVSTHKLARITSIATAENQEFLANQIKLLPKSAIETLARDIKSSNQVVPGHKINSSNQIEILQGAEGELVVATNLAPKQHRVHELHGSLESTKPHEFSLSDEVRQKLLELQQKGIDINKLLMEFLEKREAEIAEEKGRLAREVQATPKDSRYIPVAIKKLLKKEYGTKCSIHNCQKASEELHHTQRFSLAKTHNPYFLAPLCHEHHLIAHTIDLNFHKVRQGAVASS